MPKIQDNKVISEEIKKEEPVSPAVDDILIGMKDIEISQVLRTIINTQKDHEKRINKLEPKQ